MTFSVMKFPVEKEIRRKTDKLCIAIKFLYIRIYIDVFFKIL